MIKMKFNQKGQGALEYLILIGAAILVAVIVVTLILGTSTSGKQTNEQTSRSYEQLVTNTIIPPTIISVSCDSNTSARYLINESVTEDVNSYCLVIDGDVNINNCVLSATTLNFTISPTLTDGETYDMSLVAQKGNAYSAPTLPAPDCTVPE